ncbi:MAG TPA: glycosyltransferase, partial [Methylomirabilota bacterium]
GLLRFPEAGLAGPTFQAADGSTRPAVEPVPSIGNLFSRLTPLRYLRRLWRTPRWRPRPDTPVAAGYVIGACLLIRREVLEEVGWLDEGYHLYWEDMEYARRALQRGWKLLWVSGAVVQHARAGSSAGVATGERHWLSLVGARRYFGARWKPAGIPGLWALFKALYVTNAVLVCCEGAVKAALHGLLGHRARVARHRQRRADAWAFLRRHLWDLVRL